MTNTQYANKTGNVSRRPSAWALLSGQTWSTHGCFDWVKLLGRLPATYMDVVVVVVFLFFFFSLSHQRGIPPLHLMLNSQVTEQVSEHRHLGVILDDQLKWQANINSITNSVAKNVYLLSRLRHFCNSEACNTFFHAHIMSRINYVSNVAAVMYISKNLKPYTNVQSKFFVLLRQC